MAVSTWPLDTIWSTMLLIMIISASCCCCRICDSCASVAFSSFRRLIACSSVAPSWSPSVLFSSFSSISFLFGVFSVCSADSRGRFSALMSLPSILSTRLSSLAPMSTTLTSYRRLLVMVGRVCPGTSTDGSSLISRMISPALTILRLPASYCFLQRWLSSVTSSKTISPVMSSPCISTFCM